MQFSIILGILISVLNGKMTKIDLAKKFEISVRTVTRYIAVIANAGIPIETTPGKHGGVSLPDSYTLDRSFFTTEELKRLSTCLIAMQNTVGDNMNALLLDKINLLAKNKADEQYLLKSDTLIIDAGTWTNPRHYLKKIEIINKAIAQELSLSLCYVDRNELRTERLFDPYSLVLKEGVWYTYGYCHLREDFRLFKLTRIQKQTVTSKQFVRRQSDVFSKLNEIFDESELVEVEFEFFSTVLADVEEWLGMDSVTDEGQKYVARATLYGGNMLIKKLLSFGSSITVLSPPALREELMVECKRIVNNYFDLKL